jgi:hypothetical protein
MIAHKITLRRRCQQTKHLNDKTKLNQANKKQRPATKEMERQLQRILGEPHIQRRRRFHIMEIHNKMYNDQLNPSHQ